MRIPVSAPQNTWTNGRTVDDTDLTLEQNFNNTIQSGIVNNHFGSGVLPDALTQHVLFDSAATTGFLDGKAINIQSQPTDNNLGNQLNITLSNSLAAGTRRVKVLIIGLDFQNNLQYDALTFNRNESQITSKHYTSVLTILFNDFFGLATQSFNLGGRIVISEANPLTLSRDCVMISQDTQPNLFFRDFFVSSGGTLTNVLVAALPSYNISSLNITSGFTQLASIAQNDVSSQVGQKFLASTNNIQKITLLIAVLPDGYTPTNFIWTGDLIVSIYPLQSTVSCQTDITPNLAIDFNPSNVPLAQLSFNYNTLLSNGIQLGSVPQPVDFVFSNTPVGSGLLIKPGNYYAVTAKRAGSDDSCQIQFAVGTNSSSITRETLFNGNIWVDVPEQSLWFQVWTDSAKVADGQAYDSGHGVMVPKTQISSTTGATQDFILNQLQFVRNDLYFALLQAITAESVPIQDERTGNNINSEQQFVPTVTLLNTNSLANIQGVSNPLILGTISDKNVKTINFSTSTLSAEFHEYGMVDNQIVLKVITDINDGYRYNQNIIELVSELVEGNLNGAKFIPDIANPSLFYRVAKSELITMLYGDVDGNGVIDDNDLLLAQQLVGSNLNIMPSHDQYIVQTTLFVSDINLTWQVMNGMTVVESGTDGILTANPNNGAMANFQSASASFSTIPSLDADTIVISNSATAGNNGIFTISSLIDNHNITINKIFYTSDTILQIMRGDISGDMILDSTDIGYISNYVETVEPFPAPTPPANKVGTSFNAIRITLEEYIDREDDYSTNSSTRASIVHPLPDIFLDGYSLFENVNLKINPITFNVVKQLVWDSASVVVNSNPRLVPCAFTYQSGYQNPSCGIPGATSSVVYPTSPSFDPGRNDFFVSNNLVVNNGGQIIRPDGYFMKMDFEVSTIILEIPPVSFDGYTINILSDFIANYSGTGYTRLGYTAMKFADCTPVSMDGLIENQVKFGVAMQSFSPQLNGLDPDCISGILVDNKMGVFIDYLTGIITLNFSNLFQDPVNQTLNTKVEITVYLKKAGWNNNIIFVDSMKAQNILNVPSPAVSSVICPDPPIVVIS